MASLSAKVNKVKFSGGWRIYLGKLLLGDNAILDDNALPEGNPVQSSHMDFSRNGDPVCRAIHSSHVNGSQYFIAVCSFYFNFADSRIFRVEFNQWKRKFCFYDFRTEFDNSSKHRMAT